MKKRLQQLIWSLTLVGGLLFAQDKQLAKADKMFYNLEYIDAMKIYKNLAENDGASTEVYQKLGDINYFNAKYKDAASWYEKAFALDNNLPADYSFRYGQALKSTGQMQKADVYLNKYYRSNAAKYVPSTSYMNAIEKASGKHKIEKVNFNSNYSDYPAFLDNNQLYVVTADQSNKTNSWNDEPGSDIYMGSELKLMGKTINTKYNEGSLVITKDGQTMYFTRNDYVEKKLGKDNQKVTQLKLLRTDKVDGEWSKPKELPFNSSEYSVGHPALSADESKLFFVSNMPGGKGGTDIYESEIFEDNTYGAPINLAAFNTVANEMFPFVDKDDTFYFSSNGHPNIGGLDVFYAKTNADGVFETVMNIGRPVNSSFDDFAYVVEGDSGYFASNRDNQNDDIYSFVQLEPLQDASVELDKIVNIMKQYPEMEVDVRSYTDSRGSAKYNLALSKRRNRSTIKYLVDHGISSSRLTGRGYGETELVNYCSSGVKCYEQMHSQNRRSEFIIIKK